jgi:DNA-binding IclR family transcriptional regulator
LGNAKTRSVPALERGLALLEILANSNKGMRLRDIARSLGIAKSSAHCLVLTLERHDYLERNESTRRYMFSLKLYSLANLALSRIKVRDVAAPFLQGLVDSTRMAAHLAILEQNEAVLIAKVERPGLLRVATWIGKRMDVHCTGLGKALLAHLADGELDRLLTNHGLPRHNENTITSPRKLKEQLALIRKLGYSVDEEEDEVGLCCIGAPIFDHSGKVIAAVSIAGTASRIGPDNRTALAEQVKKTALEISRKMGHIGHGIIRG